jgi:hypothetical protein
MMKARKKSRQKDAHVPEQRPDELEAAVDLPNREVMTLIDPNLMGGGLLGGTTGGTPSVPGGATNGTGVPAPQPGVTSGGTLSTGISPLDKFMPSTSQPAGTPYDPSTSASSET